MMLYPCVRYQVAGQARVLWLSPREALSLELGEAAIQHALGIAREANGTDIRIEFNDGAAPDRCVMRLRVGTSTTGV